MTNSEPTGSDESVAPLVQPEKKSSKSFAPGWVAPVLKLPTAVEGAELDETTSQLDERKEYEPNCMDCLHSAVGAVIYCAKFSDEVDEFDAEDCEEFEV